jgi:hypothetical protein
MNPLERRARSLGIRGFAGIVAVYFWSVIASAEPPSPADLLPSKYLGSEYTIVEQVNKSLLIKNNIPQPLSEDPRIIKLDIRQYNSFLNHPGPCEGGSKRVNSSAQITEQSGQIIQMRFRMGMHNGKEFKLHVLTDPANPSSANTPLFWYEDLEKPIGTNHKGATIYKRVFINEEHYTYLPEDHPIRLLSKLLPQKPLPLVRETGSPPCSKPPGLGTRVLSSLSSITARMNVRQMGVGLRSMGVGGAKVGVATAASALPHATRAYIREYAPNSGAGKLIQAEDDFAARAEARFFTGIDPVTGENVGKGRLIDGLIRHDLRRIGP